MPQVIITCDDNSIWTVNNGNIKCDYGFQTIDYDTFVNNISQSIIESQNIPTLVSIFEMPIQADMQQAFMLGFGLPVIVYLTSYAYQAVINFASKDY